MKFQQKIHVKVKTMGCMQNGAASSVACTAWLRILYYIFFGRKVKTMGCMQSVNSVRLWNNQLEYSLRHFLGTEKGKTTARIFKF